jgi:branched-chain amino acid transport system ATP-binding protein
MVQTFLQLNREQGIAILLIEHVMRAVMALASQIVVLHHGEVIARGAPAEVVRSPQVLEVYLGTESDV